MESSHLPAELRDLIDRVAAHPHGLGFLHTAYLDGVAVTLATHPFVVLAARELLDTPSGRAMMIEEVRRARDRLQQDGPSSATEERTFPGISAAVSQAAPPRLEDDRRPVESDLPPDAPHDAEQLIEKARSGPLGIRFLLQAPPETVAVTFGVHPFLVFRARGMIRSRKVRSPDSEEEFGSRP